MIYADTDFFLALIKGKDWLKENAIKIYKKYKGNIETSDITLLELMFACRKYKLDPEIVMGSVFELANSVENITVEEGMKVAWLIKSKKFAPADAFHSVLSKDRPILTSESKFAELGHKVIDLKNK